MTSGPGLPEVLAGALFVSMNAYLLTGGADLGGGVWDLLASGPRRAEQRALIASAIGPIWEADHVWLVIAVVLCFTGFPPAFAVLTTVLHIPLTIALVGIVLRGSAFVFRAYGSHEPGARTRWGRVFAIASVVTPVALGVVAGALSTDAVPAAYASVASASFSRVFVAPWLAPFPLLVGALTLALVAQLAATYLTLVTNDPALADDFRRRALASAAVAAALAIAATTVARSALWFSAGGLVGPHSWPWVGMTALASILGAWALWRRHFRVARLAVGAEVSMILWGWAAAQYPYLIPRAVTIRSAAAPRSTLEALTWALIIGGVVLIPSLRFLLARFSGAEAASAELPHARDSVQ